MNQAEKSDQLRSLIERIAPEGGLERLADEPAGLEAMAPPGLSGAAESEEEFARTAFRKLVAGEEINEDEMFGIEAIILPEGRPVIDVVGDSYTAPAAGLWTHLDDAETRTRIEAAIPAIGRVELPDDLRIPYGGTGFVVGPDLLMTNRHVAELFARGLGRRELRFRPGQSAEIDFKRERVFSEPVVVQVREVMMIHPFWDMALLRVEGLAEGRGPLTLSVTAPQDLAGQDLAVVGYPAFDPRNNTVLQNKIFGGTFNVKRLQPGKLGGRQTVRSFGNSVSAVQHDASTLGGNSGSAVIHLASGEIVALHFAGRYKESNWAVPTYELARDSRVIDAGVVFAGASPPGPITWQAQWLAADPEETGGGKTEGGASPTPAAVQAGPRIATWTIPLTVTVDLGEVVRASGATGGGALPTGAPSAEVEKPGTLPDPSYENRAGYDPAFLGHGHEVPIPWLTDEQYEKVAFNLEATSQRHVLPYNHFSVVMNGERKIAYLTAVNIDGSREMSVSRSDFRDVWSPDTRIDPTSFLDNDFYRSSGGVDNPLDRGHLVRRLDPCWGTSLAEVLGAHHDTFHWTNSSPQHSGYNRNRTTWGGVENHILHGANNNDLKVSVFTGPVFRDDDPVYDTPTNKQAQIPLDFWKIVVMVKPDGQLSATGFVISQSELIQDMVEFAFTDKFEQFQTTIKSIEEMTGLSFRDLADHDPLASAQEGLEGATVRVPLSSYRTVVTG